MPSSFSSTYRNSSANLLNCLTSGSRGEDSPEDSMCKVRGSFMCTVPGMCITRYIAVMPIIHIRRCLHCKQDFILKNIAYEKRGHGKYCSKQCSKYATKKHSFNEHFFDIIDTPTKAYWLGFIMADGCNTGDEITVELSSKDAEQLYKLKKDLDATQNISYRLKKEHKMVLLRLASRYMCLKLSEIGCTPRKSFTLQYPKAVPVSLTKDFVRGYFDGDGCLHIQKDKKNRIWSIYSVSHDFILELFTRIAQETGIQPHLYEMNGKNKKKGYVIAIMRRNDINTIQHWLYDGATTYMERKHKKFDPPM